MLVTTFCSIIISNSLLIVDLQDRLKRIIQLLTLGSPESILDVR